MCRFYLREKLSDSLWADGFTMDPQLIRDYFYRFLYQPQDREYPDLCQLPDLNEQTLLDNLRARFNAGHIYTYVGSILIAVNPFKVNLLFCFYSRFLHVLLILLTRFIGVLFIVSPYL